ncbi:hypothetical protein Hypma_014003 [Hypsizygus marmoreus]|uniref:Domain of unknown function at the cortex 1 domain-containing protein n=1 Tax=Hypsizygus marmoreus TaxID=39966 RepID=A0A369KE94_HYPMA|nr:hypothetical protein Hypma_014003 [Hypsizygus marmoreus]
MAPRLRVLAGTSLSTLVPITDLVNTTNPHKLSSELFDGEVVVNIKGFPTRHGDEYFGREDRRGITWSIQVRGRFLTPHSADDILFGNTFDRPLWLPWGSGAALKFMHYIDPTLEHDLISPTKPWALSPLIATMPHFMHTRITSHLNDSTESLELPSSEQQEKSNPQSLPPFPPAQSISDNTSQLHLALVSHPSAPSSSSSSSPSSSSSSSSLSSSLSSTLSISPAAHPSYLAPPTRGGKPIDKIKNAARKKLHKPKSETKQIPPTLNLHTAAQRRAYFSDSARRREIVFGPEDVITTDFCYGFLEFSPSLALRLPGGLSFDLMRYWDGQPVRFVCCERRGAVAVDDELDNGEGEDGDKVEGEEEGEGEGEGEEVPWGTVFWCVSIEMDEDEEGKKREEGV